MVAQKGAFSLPRMRAAAAALGADRPDVAGNVDWDRVVRHRVEIYTIAGDWAPLPPGASEADRRRATAHGEYASGRLGPALDAFRDPPREPSSLTETALLAEGLADRGLLEATPYIDALGAASPGEAEAAAARLAYRRGRPDLALAELGAAFTRYRGDPWPSQSAMGRALALAREIAAAHPETAPRVLDLLAPAFSVRVLDQERVISRVLIARSAGLWDRCRDALAPLEPYVPWQPQMLGYRAECYARTGDPRAVRAGADLQEFLAAEPPAAPPASAPPPGVAVSSSPASGSVASPASR
jgi:hypothetical protein